jgi:hypothetical protein
MQLLHPTLKITVHVNRPLNFPKLAGVLAVSFYSAGAIFRIFCWSEWNTTTNVHRVLLLNNGLSRCGENESGLPALG